MKKFNSVKDFDEYLKNVCGYGLEVGYEDYEKFIGNREFEIIFDEDEDMIIRLDNKKYYIDESIMGAKFIEV